MPTLVIILPLSAGTIQYRTRDDYITRSGHGRCATDPFSELIVHHEVVYVLLGAGQFELASEDGHHQRCAP